MSIPQRRPGAGEGRPAIPGHQSAGPLLDRLVRNGTITAGQAAQYRIWESARPPIDGGRERFDAWMSSRPNLPGLPPVKHPSDDAGRRRGVGTTRPARKNVMEMLDTLERENKITEAQAEQVRRWDRARPNGSAGQERFDAWMKARPDVPGLREYW